MLLFNMGLPMIVPVLYFMVIALIPIILIESIFLSGRLNIAFRNTIGSVVLGNILSTIVGIPITWFVLLMIQFGTGGASGYGVGEFWRKLFSFTLQAPWLLPFAEDESWTFSAAALFLLIPFFFATWLIEYVTTRDKLVIEVVRSRYDAVKLREAERIVLVGVRDANLLSYGLIVVLLTVSLVISLVG